jgi:hypothetical protein
MIPSHVVHPLEVFSRDGPDGNALIVNDVLAGRMKVYVNKIQI